MAPGAQGRSAALIERDADTAAMAHLTAPWPDADQKALAGSRPTSRIASSCRTRAEDLSTSTRTSSAIRNQRPGRRSADLVGRRISTTTTRSRRRPAAAVCHSRSRPRSPASTTPADEERRGVGSAAQESRRGTCWTRLSLPALVPRRAWWTGSRTTSRCAASRSRRTGPMPTHRSRSPSRRSGVSPEKPHFDGRARGGRRASTISPDPMIAGMLAPHAARRHGDDRQGALPVAALGRLREGGRRPADYLCIMQAPVEGRGQRYAGDRLARQPASAPGAGL